VLVGGPAVAVGEGVDEDVAVAVGAAVFVAVAFGEGALVGGVRVTDTLGAWAARLLVRTAVGVAPAVTATVEVAEGVAGDTSMATVAYSVAEAGREVAGATGASVHPAKTAVHTMLGSKKPKLDSRCEKRMIRHSSTEEVTQQPVLPSGERPLRV
jgi:phosphate/sulfate permease